MVSRRVRGTGAAAADGSGAAGGGTRGAARWIRWRIRRSGFFWGFFFGKKGEGGLMDEGLFCLVGGDGDGLSARVVGMWARPPRDADS